MNLTRPKRKKTYTDSHKAKAVLTFVVTGSNSLTAQQCKIPLKTIEQWKTTKWWKDQVQELKNTRNTQMQGNLKNLFDKATKQLEDRIEYGDHIWDQKKGCAVRIPVGSRNLNQIAKDSIDRQVLLDKATIPTKEEHIDINQRLTELLQEFKRIGRSGGQLTQGEVIDVEPIERPVEESAVEEAVPSIPEFKPSGDAR